MNGLCANVVVDYHDQNIRDLNSAGCSTALTASNTTITCCPPTSSMCPWKLEHVHQALDCMEEDVLIRRPAARLGRETRIHTALDRLGGCVFTRTVTSVQASARISSVCCQPRLKTAPNVEPRKVCLSSQPGSRRCDRRWHA